MVFSARDWGVPAKYLPFSSLAGLGKGICFGLAIEGFEGTAVVETGFIFNMRCRSGLGFIKY